MGLHQIDTVVTSMTAQRHEQMLFRRAEDVSPLIVLHAVRNEAVDFLAIVPSPP